MTKYLMSKTTPVREKNAIDQIAFVILFEKELDNKTLAKLMSLEDELSSDLPHFEVPNTVQLFVDPQNMRMPLSKPGGVICSKKSAVDPNRLEWSVNAEVNNIVVTCSEYTNWKEIKKKALNFLFTTSKKFNLKDNPIIEIVYECVDKFIFDGSQNEYRVDEVFNLHAAYLTPHVVNSNPYAWHVHQGWFSEHQDMVALHNLNLNSHKQNGQSSHETVISHLVKIRKKNGTKINDKHMLVGNSQEVGYLEKAMEVSHDLNKKILLNLLNERMLKAIGIKS